MNMNRNDEISVLGFCGLTGEKKPEELKNAYIKDNTLNKLDPELKLYRILPYKRLLDSLEKGCLDMVHPSKWPDPNETFLLNNKRYDESDGSLVSLNEIKGCIYCQCWSITEESNALWQIYSLKKVEEPISTEFHGDVFFENLRSVRIRSTGDKLINSLYDMHLRPLPQKQSIYYVENGEIVNEEIEDSLCQDHPWLSMLECFIGRVKYAKREDINKLRESNVSEKFINCNGRGMIETLFIKENAYEYEKEVRLVFYNVEKKHCNEKTIWEPYYSFNIDINNVIEEITFHPKLPDANCTEMEAEIRALGYKGLINKSKLFALDNRILPFQ